MAASSPTLDVNVKQAMSECLYSICISATDNIWLKKYQLIKCYLFTQDLTNKKLTPKFMGCLRLVYHGGVDSPPPPKISAPMAPTDMKFYMLVVFGLYF